MINNREKLQIERKIEKQLLKAITKFSLIEDGDKVLVGLSGGKDSLCLLEMLAKRKKIYRPSFNVEAIHVRMDNIKYESDTKYLEQFSTNVGIKLHVVNTSFDDTTVSRKPVCFLCSWHRRKAIFNFAQENGFNKIALGHHMDDIIHTTLMNEIFQGQFSTMPAKLTMKKMPLAIIRPLCMVEEADIKAHALFNDYKEQIKKCPYEHISKRQDVSLLFEQIQKINPEARYSIWNALETENKLIE